MKTRSVPRSLAVVLLMLTLAAASAPAAWALPAAPTGAHAPAWDLGSLFDWIQGVLGGWIGGGGGGAEEGQLQSLFERDAAALEPDGSKLLSASPRGDRGTSEPVVSDSGSW